MGWIPRPCLSCNRVQSFGSRCRDCTATRDRQRGTSTQRGYTSAYRRNRQEILEYAGGICHWCGSNGEGRGGMTADHLVPLYDGGDSEIQNLLPACKRCNVTRGNLMRKAK